MGYSADRNSLGSYAVAIDTLRKRRKMAPGLRSIIPDKDNREKNDFYVTPSGAVEALLRHEKFSGPIWEPACGDGAISEVLKAHGHEVESTDLIDRGYGVSGVDFLETSNRFTSARTIVTNPPFKHALEFAQHGLAVASHVALLCRLQFLESKKRKPLFEHGDFKKLIVFSDRVPIWRRGELREGGKNIAYAWFIWDKTYRGAPTIEWTLFNPPSS